MNSGDWLFIFEFGGSFAIIMLLGWWQLRALKRDEEREKGEKSAKGVSPPRATRHAERQHRTNDAI